MAIAKPGWRNEDRGEQQAGLLADEASSSFEGVQCRSGLVPEILRVPPGACRLHGARGRAQAASTDHRVATHREVVVGTDQRQREPSSVPVPGASSIRSGGMKTRCPPLRPDVLLGLVAKGVKIVHVAGAFFASGIPGIRCGRDAHEPGALSAINAWN